MIPLIYAYTNHLYDKGSPGMPVVRDRILG
jgi:hypothetical protein